jgi:maltose O-acetyltransferase
MPYLTELPDTLSPETQAEIPASTRWVRFLCKALGLPFAGRLQLIQSMLCQALDVPSTTSFQDGFYSRRGRLHCGNHVALGDTHFFDRAPVYIDDYCGFSFRNVVVTSMHDVRDFNRVIAKPVILERNVWITVNCTILGGVRIGENSIIAAGSVVTHDIPGNVLAAGNPCRPVRTIERDTERKNFVSGHSGITGVSDVTILRGAEKSLLRF